MAGQDAWFTASFERDLTPDEIWSDEMSARATAPVELAVHPNTDSGLIVINYPGANGEIDGFNDKYVKLADHIRGELPAAVLRTNNAYIHGLEYPASVQQHLRAVIEFAIEHADEIAGRHPEGIPRIHLMGYSAGAGAVAAVAHEYPEHILNMLLIAPAGDAGMTSIREGLSRFRGVCNILIGRNDDLVGVGAADIFRDMAMGSAALVRTHIVEDCDHQFRGTPNGVIMSAAPMWAFAGEPIDAPDPARGIVLY